MTAAAGSDRLNAGQFPVVVVVDGKILEDYQPVNLRRELSVH